jgi:hypothetical protein
MENKMKLLCSIIFLTFIIVIVSPAQSIVDQNSTGTTVSINCGTAIPLWSFGGSTNGAKIGFSIDAQYIKNGSIGWILVGSYSQNPAVPGSFNMFSGNANTSSDNIWRSFTLLGGIKIGTTLFSKIDLFVAPLLGAMVNKSPNLSGTETLPGYYFMSISSSTPSTCTITNTCSESSVTKASFAYGFEAELILWKLLTIGGRYVITSPDYTIQGVQSQKVFDITGYPNQTVYWESHFNDDEKPQIGLCIIYLGIAF